MLSHVMCLTLFLKNTFCFHPLFGVYGGVILICNVTRPQQVRPKDPEKARGSLHPQHGIAEMI